MLNIRPVSDLRNKYPEIEKLVMGGEEVYLTKNVPSMRIPTVMIRLRGIGREQ